MPTPRTTPKRRATASHRSLPNTGRVRRQRLAVRALAIGILLAMLAPLAALADATPPATAAEVDQAVARARRIGELFDSPHAAATLRVAVLRELTSPADLPPPPLVIPDPVGVDMLESWDGDLAVELLDDAIGRRVVDFVRRAGRSSELRSPTTSTRPESTASTVPAGPAGELLCPIDGPVRFINDWGFPRSGGRRHQGNDLFALEGTPIVAVRDAIITSVSRVDRGLGGLHVSYVDDTGDRWYNAHLSSVATGLEAGMTVTQGQIVGYVGRTGNARTTPPHNHIQWHPAGGAPQNPYFRLRAACP